VVWIKGKVVFHRIPALEELCYCAPISLAATFFHQRYRHKDRIDDV
jgi:hypothetical protein